MKNLKEKLRKNGGFTLVEMLIVVAIIAILIAVSIPMIGSALERSRHAVDQANERDAISLATIAYLTGVDSDGNTITYEADGKVKLYYHVDANHQGKINTTEAGAVTPACTCTNHDKGGVGSGTGGLMITLTKSDGTVDSNWAIPSQANPDENP